MKNTGKKPEYVKLGGLLVLASRLSGDTLAEHMLDTAKRFNALRKDAIIVPTEVSSKPFEIEYTVACLKFAKLPGSILLRAIVEAWTYDDIIREVRR